MVRAFPALLTLTGLSQSNAAGLDTSSLVQQQLSFEQPASGITNERDEAMSRWIAGMYRILRSRPNPLLNKCCNLAQEHGVKPWRSWGTMNESMVGLWHANNCNQMVGAHVEHYAVGTPYCDQTKAFVVLDRPAELLRESFEDEIGAVTKVSCTEEDRLALNNTYLGKRTSPALGEECMPENLASFSLQHGTFRGCVSTLMGISMSCTKCHANFLRSISGLKAPYSKCFDTCFPLMTCSRLSQCPERAQQCSACVQPALYEANTCIGGPIMNRLRMENVFEQIIRFSPR